MDTTMFTGAEDGKTTIKVVKTTLNNVLICFSPISKGKEVLLPNSKADTDVLIATDYNYESQNLRIAITM